MLALDIPKMPCRLVPSTVRLRYLPHSPFWSTCAYTVLTSSFWSTLSGSSKQSEKGIEAGSAEALGSIRVRRDTNARGSEGLMALKGNHSCGQAVSGGSGRTIQGRITSYGQPCRFPHTRHNTPHVRSSLSLAPKAGLPCFS